MRRLRVDSLDSEVSASHSLLELGVLSDKEESFVKQTIESKEMPSPKLLIKGHKNPDTEGNFPARLVGPSNKLQVSIPKDWPPGRDQKNPR